MSQKTVLIVEDDADIREGLTTLFTGEGFSVQTAANGEEALRLLAEPPHPAVIVMDLFMPGMDGWHFHHLVKKNPEIAGIPIVAVTASSPNVQLPRGIELVRKPLDLGRLLAVVNKHIA